MRAVRVGDGAALARAYRANREHLAPWEPSRDETFFADEWQEQNAQQCVADAVAGRSTSTPGQLKLHRLQAATLIHNTGSQAVLTANGFERIGHAPRYLRVAGEWQDHLLFQRLLE
ncbi:hypothetical protein J7E28_14660 [Microbacterium sp. ISL-108]|nr:hypothetical protein [Microbacterium sp. ISL-108]RKN69647.1 hypothetical protein D7252_14640 [Microbacterium sp. CGR2]